MDFEKVWDQSGIDNLADSNNFSEFRNLCIIVYFKKKFNITILI